MKDISKILIQLRGKRTQTEVATAIGVTQPAYCKWEKGDSKPRSDNFQRLAGYYKISLDGLMNGQIIQLSNSTNQQSLDKLSKEELFEELRRRL
ncbi:MAG: helix-turn-helix domain-containing protein [Tannerellaceae bacterium]|nr:helix-turn-helix domain-containing protein [Tannerellaceae bacterium]